MHCQARSSQLFLTTPKPQGTIPRSRSREAAGSGLAKPTLGRRRKLMRAAALSQATGTWLCCSPLLGDLQNWGWQTVADSSEHSAVSVPCLTIMRTATKTGLQVWEQDLFFLVKNYVQRGQIILFMLETVRKEVTVSALQNTFSCE